MLWVGEWQGALRWAPRAPGPLTAPAAQMPRLVVGLSESLQHVLGLSESLQHVLGYDGVYLVEVHATPYPYCHQFAGHPYA